LNEQRIAIRGSSTLLRMDQPDDFDSPGCPWPDPKHPSSFEFCENGAEAVAWEAMAERCSPEFFAAHSVTELEGWSDHDLETPWCLSMRTIPTASRRRRNRRR
jgi:hypothetical protein